MTELETAGDEQFGACFGVDTLSNIAAFRAAILEKTPEGEVIATAKREEPEHLQLLNEMLREEAGTLWFHEDDESFDRNDNRQVLQKLLEWKKQFDEQASARYEHLQDLKAQFSKRMHRAIDEQGLPLAHEQLDARLEPVDLQFAHPLELGDGTQGGFGVINGVKKAYINTELTSDKLPQTVFHELLHAVSGMQLNDGELKRVGFHFTEDNRVWANEALTDVLSYILLDNSEGMQYDFGDSERPLWLAAEPGYASTGSNITIRTMRNFEARDRAYFTYKSVFIDATAAIPAKTLLEAYFKQDGDHPFEVDQRAGSHAERELQRAIKRLGGIGRVAALREVNGLFTKAAEIAKDPRRPGESGEMQGLRAEKIAADMRESDQSPGIAWQRRAFSAEVAANTKARQVQIDRAKRHLAA